MTIKYHYKDTNNINQEICSITSEIPNHPIITICGHIFDKGALNVWLDKSNVCPVCRTCIKNDIMLEYDYEDYYEHDNKIMCPITLKITNHPVITKCNHIFDKDALDLLLESSNGCPCCNKNIKKIKDNKNYTYYNNEEWRYALNYYNDKAYRHALNYKVVRPLSK
jgi:SUMO ligase MMS21 Smc5/6 complex component